MTYNYSKPIFDFRAGSRFPVSAQIAGEICAELEEQNALTAKNLVNVSTTEDAPLHCCFEWNNEKAGNLYREEQARHLIRAIVTIMPKEEKEEEEEDKEPKMIECYHHIDSEGGGYRSLDRIMCHPEMLDALREQCRRDMQTFIQKYRSIVEISSIVEAMEETLNRGAI